MVVTSLTLLLPNIAHSTNSARHIMSLYQCSCGVKKVIKNYLVKSGASKSCGCIRKHQARKTFTKHNMSSDITYNSWRGMITRGKGKCAGSPKYKEKGIVVYGPWAKFQNFYNDVGPRPSKEHSLDRINNDGNYEPGNVRWATKKEQNNNQDVRKDAITTVINGKLEVLSRYCKANNLNYRLIKERVVYMGWSIEEALNTPKIKGRSGRKVRF